MKSYFPSNPVLLPSGDGKEDILASVSGGLLISAIYRLLSPALTGAER
jgi:hypothetical protein